MKDYLKLAVFGTLALTAAAQAAPHGMYLTRDARELSKTLNLETPAAGTKVLYYGGPVIGNAKVYAIMWGSKVNATTVKQVPGFYQSVLNSSYMDWLKEYNTNIKSQEGKAGTNQTVGRGTYAGLVTITPKNTSTKLKDSQVQAELDAQIQAKRLPKPDANTLFMIYFPPEVSISFDDGSGSSCQQFCAYHEGFVSKTNGNVFYGVMPDQGGACAFGCAFSDNAWDDLSSISSHELVEAVTDAFPTPGSTPAYPQAWNTSDGYEVGDLCANPGQTAQVKTQGLTYIVQDIFDNTTGACSTASSYQSP